MSSLELRLHKQSIQTSMGAVATLQQVTNEGGESLARGRRINVTIPANPGSSTQQVNVEPGRWLIEATLPSGEVVGGEVIVASGQDLPVTLYSAEQSPHEWLGLQYLVGNIEGSETLKRLRDNPTEESLTLAITDPIRADDARRVLAGTEPPVVRTCQGQAVLLGTEAWAKIFSPDSHTLISCDPTWADSSQATWLYQIAGDGPRRFGLVEWLGEQFAVSLPLPWLALRQYQPVQAQVMVRMEPRQNNIRIGVVIEDPDFAAMAGLMTASTLPQAAVAVGQAREMLFEKMENPLGAAAGGYVLLAAGDREDDSWHGWIDNLAQRFPQIPDGAILKASLRLRFPKSESSAEEARASLLDAFDRGIPYYSAGVSWLLDGLTQFADDPAIQEKMKVVHRVALRLNLSQAFTVIRISDRAKR